MKHKNVLFMLAALIVAALSTPASAYDFMEGGLCYNINSDGSTVTVTYENNSGSHYTNLVGDIVIPVSVTHNNVSYPVREIGIYAFYKCTEMTSVSIPWMVSTIGREAFYGCTALTKVEQAYNNSLLNINNSAFEGCTSLTEFTIPTTISSLGSGIFRDCTSLTKVDFPNYFLEYIPSGMFSRCTALQNMTLPSKVKEIGSNAFSGCTSMTSIDLGFVKTLGEGAFRGSGLTCVTIPPTLNNIGFWAFAECLNLSSIEFQNSKIARNQFLGCTALKNVTIPDYITEVGYSAFEGCGLTSVNIENSVTSNYQFKDCTQLKTINFGSALTKISQSAFDGCTALESLDIPNTITTIIESAFANCTSLKKVTLGEAITEIASGAFKGSPISELNWNIINYPTPTQSYEALHLAFDVTNLAKLTFGDKVQHIPNEAAYNANLKSLTIPASVTAIDDGAFTGTTVEELISSSNLVAGCALFPNAKATLKTVTLLDGVTVVPANAFKGCSVLNTVTMPGILEEIGNAAFSGCTKLRDLYCKMPRPFAIDASVFDGVQVKGFCDLHVIEGSKPRYEMMDVWKEFGVIVEDAGQGGGGSGRLNEFDVNADGNVDVGDVNAVLNYILEHN